LPARGSHRSGRARLTHPARQVMDWQPDWAIPGRYVDTACGPQRVRRVSRQRFHDSATPFLLRVLSDRVPPVQRYYELLRLPTALPAALRFLRLAVPGLHSWFRSRHSRMPPQAGLELVTRCLHPGIALETAGSPTFLGNPRVPVPCSSTPARPTAPSPFRCVGTAPDVSHHEGSPREVISGLNHTTLALAVYASQPGLPRHHARLASGRWLGSTGRD